ncbi:MULTISPECIES: hypothetical protein [unclassified Acinetobacter]|uniref:hypothetical protein n=1 Tax=unclassified Acinetobacter TaxID=196816 RepID=UPI001C550638|nr:MULTISPECIES: hypothetical protein [unclassified Acinetobacter]UUS65716.1 hypothetical protein MST18_02905 [Acinetobacter sp. YH12068_T]
MKLLIIIGITLSFNSLAWSALPENNQISSILKNQLSDKILTESEIMEGAAQTQGLYQYCIQDTVSKLKLMYPDADQAIDFFHNSFFAQL